jgi:hypothetical protein
LTDVWHDPVIVEQNCKDCRGRLLWKSFKKYILIASYLALGLETRAVEWSEDPVEFAMNLRAGDHSILIYHDSYDARTIEAAFLLTGLLRGEHAIYLTAFEDPAWTSKSLEEAGVRDIERYHDQGLLKILKIKSPADETEEFTHAFGELYKKVLAGVKPPYRLVGRLYNLVFEKQVERNIKVETTTQNMSKVIGGSIMCSYDMSKISDQMQLPWFPPAVKAHHALISAPGGNRGVGFFMR